jgi:aspartyl-tRNA(Asn)/glutamyl-tRNA(Gln) amidotransferase subunit B
MNRLGRSIEDPPVSAFQLGQLLDRIVDKTINGKIAKEVFESVVETGHDPDEIILRKGLRQIVDPEQIKVVVDSVIKGNEKLVEQYRAGKDKLFGAFVGLVMKALNGRANPALVNETLKRHLAATEE